MELDELDKSNFSFITFRAHSSEPQVFEDFISYFIPHISLKFPFYIYSIEDDDTPSRHIHILIKHYEKDKQKLKQRIEAKWYKDFSKLIKDKQTDLRYALVYGRGPDGDSFGFTMTIEDKMKSVGYIYKDITRRNRTEGISQDLITKCCDFYYANRRIKNATDNDWKILSTKNIHVKIEQFCKEQNVDVETPELQELMVQHKYTFIQLSVKQRKMAIAELLHSHKKYDVKNELKMRCEIQGEEYIDNEGQIEWQEWRDRCRQAEKERKKLYRENENLREQIKMLQKK